MKMLEHVLGNFYHGHWKPAGRWADLAPQEFDIGSWINYQLQEYDGNDCDPPSHKVSFHWWMVLSAAGVKGGISILMLHMLPRGFEHRELFEAVIINQILLSTFIYPIILMGVIKLFSQKFGAECAEYAHHH